MSNQKHTLMNNILKHFNNIISLQNEYSSLCSDEYFFLRSINVADFDSFDEFMIIGFLSDFFSDAKNGNSIILSREHKDFISKEYKRFIIALIDYTSKNNINSYPYQYILKHLNSNWVSKYSTEYKELLLSTVKKKGMALELASENLQNDRDIVLAAVKRDGFALQFANSALKNCDEIVLAAVKKDGFAIKFASEELKNDRQIVEAAVKKNGLALQFAGPELKKDERIVEAALNQNGNALKYVNEKYIVVNPEWYYRIVEGAVKKNGNVLEYVNKYWAVKNPQQYYNIVEAAVKKNPLAIKFASEKLKSNDTIINAALKKDKRDLKVLSSNNTDSYYKIIKEKVEQNPLVLSLVDKAWALSNSNRYSEIIKSAVQKYVFALKFVDKTWSSRNSNSYSEIIKSVAQQDVCYNKACDIGEEIIEVVKIEDNMDLNEKKIEVVKIEDNIDLNEEIIELLKIEEEVKIEDSLKRKRPKNLHDDKVCDFIDLDETTIQQDKPFIDLI